MTLFQKPFLFALWVFLQFLLKNVLMFLKYVLQSIEECVAIKEKVKSTLLSAMLARVHRFGRCGCTINPRSPPTKEGTSASSGDAAQDGVDN